MEFWFITEKDKFQLPINPQEIEVSSGNSIQTVSIVNLGEINLCSLPNLTTISVSSTFPDAYNTLCNYSSLRGALESVEMFDNWRRTGQIVRFVVTGTTVNIACRIENFKYKWQGLTREITFTADLKEYRYTDGKDHKYYLPPASKHSSGKKNSKYKRPSSKPAKKPKYHVVKKGESFAAISKSIYGTTEKWREIMKLNGIKDPTKLTVGKKLVI